MKRYLPALLIACIFSIALTGCIFHFNTVGSWKNKRIDNDTRNEIAGLDKKLFKSIMTKDVKGVKLLMSAGLVKSIDKKIDTIVNTIGGAFKAIDYRLLDEYYTSGITENTNVRVRSEKENDNDYEIEYLAINKESYVSVMVSTGLPVNCMVMAIYGKYDGQWKINILEMGEYSVMDQTAPEYYALAVNHFTKNNLVDAADMIFIASQIARPAGKYFIYLKDYEMKDTYNIIVKNANTQYHFPLTIDQLKTKPQIIGVTPQFIGDVELKGVYPIIKYKSAISIDDSVALRAENKMIQSVIGDVFKGVDKNKFGIIYQAFNQAPDGKLNFRYYTFVQHLKIGKSE